MGARSARCLDIDSYLSRSTGSCVIYRRFDNPDNILMMRNSYNLITYYISSLSDINLGQCCKLALKNGSNEGSSSSTKDEGDITLGQGGFASACSRSINI